MGYVLGDKIRFYNAGVVLGLEMDVSINVDQETIPTVDKDSASWKTNIAGDRGWSVSGSANLDWDQSENVSEFFADIIAGTEIAVDVGSTTDSKFYGGNGLFTNWKLEGARNSLSTFSFEFEGSGELTEGTTT